VCMTDGWLRHRQALLILDNCEHLLGPGAATTTRYSRRQFTFDGLPGTFTCNACHTDTNIGNFPFVSPASSEPTASLVVRSVGVWYGHPHEFDHRPTDPRRALVTGLCADLGGFKPPILRGVATRAPYDVIFDAHFSTQDRQDLAAFLRAL